MSAREHDRLSSRQVLDDELYEISKRHGAGVPPDRLIGLALSGSGVRSAAFGLGVLEQLKRQGLLAAFSYLSTVSGGSHIGAWLSANCRRNANWLLPETDWREAADHVRRYSSGTEDDSGASGDRSARLVATMVTALLSLTTLVFAVAALLLLPRLLLSAFAWWPHVYPLRWIPSVLVLAGMAGAIANQLLARSPRWVNPAFWRLVFAAPVLWGTAGWLATDAGFEPQGAVVGPLVIEPRYSVGVLLAILLLLGALSTVPALLRTAALVFRNEGPPVPHGFSPFTVHAVIVLPLLASAFLLASVLWDSLIHQHAVELSQGFAVGFHQITTYGALLANAWRLWPFPVVLLFVALWGVSLSSIPFWRRPSSFLAGTLSALVGAAVLHALLCAVVLLFQRFTYQGGIVAVLLWGPALIGLALALTIVVVVGVIGRDALPGSRELWNQIGARLGAYAIGWFAVCLAATSGSVVFETTGATATPLAIAGWLATTVMGLLAARGYASDARTVDKSPLARARLIVAVMGSLVFLFGLVVAISAALDLIATRYSDQPLWMFGPCDPRLSFNELLGAFLAAVSGALVLAYRFDVNEFSLNAFYRNWLVQRYLGASRSAPGVRLPHQMTGFDGGDDLRLSGLRGSPDGSQALTDAGPLLLVNCALELGGRPGLLRSTASFTMSPLHCGSGYAMRSPSGDRREIGYVETPAYGGTAGGPTVGQAICASGAAANFNVGRHPIRLVEFVMALFNMRLGWSMPNPALRTGQPSPLLGLLQMLGEVFGGTRPSSRFIRISDGGRFDNLAIYELVKRRCRVIVVADSERDLAYTFTALVRAIRLCEEDFGARVTIDLDRLRPHPDSGFAERSFVVGRIAYPDGTDGILVYLKAVMLGREDTTVSQYRASHGEFPHELTGDVLDSEEQFNSYRRLGQEVASNAFSGFTNDGSAIDWDVLAHADYPHAMPSPVAVSPEDAHSSALAAAAILPPRPRVFISYRRVDSRGYAGHLYEHLADKYGRRNVFIDVDSIDPGADFVRTLNETLESCNTAVVIIGPQWADVLDPRGNRRLQQSSDWVRIEVNAALTRDMVVCPVLVGGATMPDAEDLPADLQPLLNRQAFALPDAGFRKSVEQLMDALDRGVSRRPAAGNSRNG